MLPWHHAFGFTLELLAAITSGASVIRSSPDPLALRNNMLKFQTNQFLAVPSIVRAWASLPDGEADLKKFSGGIIGGAPVDRALAEILSKTNLRIGYGLTEASPGVCLGEPGEWSENCLGRPVGCEVRLAANQELLFRGANACYGFLKDGEIEQALPDRWQATGDLVVEKSGALIFTGRKSDGCKLDNGRWFHPAETEARIRAAFPDLELALVIPDAAGHKLAVVVVPLKDDLPSIREIFGSLKNRFAGVHPRTRDQLPLTGKGGIDRCALQKQIFRE